MNTVDACPVSPVSPVSFTHLTGQTCRVMSFQNITFRNKFNGVWACASLVHVPRPEIVTVLRRFSQALMVKLIIPLKELLIVLREHVHKDDLAEGGPDIS